MLKTLLIAVRALVVMTMATGVLYPLAVTMTGRLLFRETAFGSVVLRGTNVIGSLLLAQQFVDDKYFWPRPSACDYGTMPASGSNLGPTSKALRKLVDKRRRNFLARQPQGLTNAVPEELLCASGSGVDPHLSPSAAAAQIERVAAARGFNERQHAQLHTLVNQLVEAPQFGVLGCPRVNVLRLNVALDQLH